MAGKKDNLESAHNEASAFVRLDAVGLSWWLSCRHVMPSAGAHQLSLACSA